MHSFPSRRSSDLILSDEELADPFGDQRRLVLALDLDREFERLLPLARAFLVQFEQFEMAAHALARADGRQETDLVAAVVRSEEHTSELPSLMRNSYALYSFHKKTKHIPTT